MTARRALAAVAVTLAVASPAASAGGLAHVWVADDQPLVVRGNGFHADAKVTVVVTKAKQVMRSTTLSGTAGGFTAHFKGELTTRCGNTVVTATDASGLRAVSRTVANDCGGIRLPGP
ncbi:MAG: hypothetical protein QOH95_1185 [Gaiellaceae bacterium]|jgi:hypothetical protein|nr:hypothetical protein [Gaiellaceae bacterium]